MKLFLTRVFSILIIVPFLIFNSFPQSFLKVKGKKIVNENGNEVFLKGIGLGGWLLQEGYMLHTSGFANAQWQIKQKITDLIGADKTEEFYKAYHKNYVTRQDIDSLAKFGFNSIRLPFHYNILTPPDSPGVYLESGFAIFDSLLSWCADNQMYLILDMHAAPGGQSDENISDYNSAYPSLWESPANQDRTVEIWRKIAERYKNEKWIGGYDLLNEPKWDLGSQNQPLRDLYIRITNSIRQVDTNHIVFIEGNWYATNFTGLTPPWDDNLVYSFHKYWNGNTNSDIQGYLNLRNDSNRPLWLGETGENSNAWYVDNAKLMEQNDISWCWWAHKKLETITSPYSARISPEYQKLLDYWSGKTSKPTSDYAYNALMKMTEDLKLENCTFRPGIIDALFRQTHETSTKPFADNEIPGIISASNYDMGLRGYAYQDADYENANNSSVWNQGNQYRNDGVDIEKCSDSFSNGYDVGWIDDGEWMLYTVNIKNAGTYDLNLRVASTNSNGKLILKLDSQLLTGFISVNSTGGWQNWQDINLNGIQLPKGQHKLQITIVNGGFNLNYLEFVLTTDGVEESNDTRIKNFKVEQNYPNPFNPSTVINYSVPKTGSVKAILFDSLGKKITTLIDEIKSPGNYSFNFDSSRYSLSSGIYFYQFTFDGRTPFIYKAVLLK